MTRLAAIQQRDAEYPSVDSFAATPISGDLIDCWQDRRWLLGVVEALSTALRRYGSPRPHWVSCDGSPLAQRVRKVTGKPETHEPCTCGLDETDAALALLTQPDEGGGDAVSEGITLEAIFAAIEREKEAERAIIGWRLTEAHLASLWAEIHAGWQQDKPMPDYDPRVVYEICGRPVTVGPGPAMAFVRGRGPSAVTQLRPVC